VKGSTANNSGSPMPDNAAGAPTAPRNHPTCPAQRPDPDGRSLEPAVRMLFLAPTAAPRPADPVTRPSPRRPAGGDAAVEVPLSSHVDPPPPIGPPPHCACACPLDPWRTPAPGPSPASPRRASSPSWSMRGVNAIWCCPAASGSGWQAGINSWGHGRSPLLRSRFSNDVDAARVGCQAPCATWPGPSSVYLMNSNASAWPAPCLTRGRARRRSRPVWCVPDESMFSPRPLLPCRRRMHAARVAGIRCMYVSTQHGVRRCFRAPTGLL
jgi:hypothetical protein